MVPWRPVTAPRPLMLGEKVLYWAHYKPNPAMRIFGFPGSREKHRTGAWQFRAQAVSQKTRKKSVSKVSKKVAAASRGATKSRARASVRDDRKATKAAAAKSSKNKRSAMPNKTAKTAAKATGSKATASKVAAKTATKPVSNKP